MSFPHTFSVEGILVLLDAAVKGVVILALAAAGTSLMRRSSAAVRHAIWLLAITGLVFLPVLSLALPGWHVLPEGWGLTPEVALTAGQEMAPDAGVAPRDDPGGSVAAQVPAGAAARVEHSDPLLADTVEAGPAAEPIPAEPVVPGAPQVNWSVLPWLAGPWAIGTAVFFVLLVLSQLSLWLLRRGSSQISSPLWIARVEAVSARLGLDRSVVLLRSDRRAMPMVWGALRPNLLLPSQCDGWPERRCQAVLLHELGHVKRWDCASKLLAQVACALYWFNPLVWIASRRMHVEAERACDDLVITSGAAPRDYAEQVLEIASGCRTSPLAAYGAIAMARKSHLEGRLLAILDRKRNRRPLTWVSALVAAVLIAGAAAVVASVRAAGPAEPSHQAPQGDRGAREMPTGAAPAEPAKLTEPGSGVSDATKVPPGTKRAAELLRALKTAENDWTQAELARKLIALGDKSIVPDVVEMLKSEDRRARCNAARVLAALGDERGLAAVLAELKDTRQRPTKMIRSDGKPNVPGQIQSDRYYAVHVLGEIGDRRAVPALVEALQDKSVNYKAAIVLGKLGDERAISPLKEMLKSDDSQERLWAGYALGKLGDPAGVPTVAVFLKDPQWTQRRHAAESLAEFADKRAVASLMEALKDERPEVRVSVARALGRIADKSAVAALEPLLKDDAVTTSGPPTAVRDAAAEAIRQIRGAAAPPAGKVETDWGPAVEGVQCRARAEKRTWPQGAGPKLQVDFRNRGKRNLKLVLGSEYWELQCDGISYRMPRVNTDGRDQVLPLGPNQQHSDYALPLGDYWRSRDDAAPLVFNPGKHVLRVAFRVWPAQSGDGPSVRVVSNAVEIEITAPEPHAAKGPSQSRTGQALDGKEVLKQLKSVDSAYEAAFTASGSRPGRMKKKWKLTMLEGEIVYQEQVVEIPEPVQDSTGPPIPPGAPKPEDDGTKRSIPYGGIRRAEYRIGEFIAFRSTLYVGPKVQAQHDWVGRIRRYGPLDPWPENSPGPATAGFLGVVKPDAPTYMLLIKRPLLCLGRGYSRYVADVKEVRREESGHLKVTADGVDLGLRAGAKWELLIDPDAAYMVRSAKMVDEKKRTTSITNSGLKRYGPRCVPEKAECRGAFIDASFEIESASPEADVAFLQRAKAAMRPPYPIHMDVHDERVTPELYVPYDAGKTSPQGRRKDWAIGF